MSLCIFSTGALAAAIGIRRASRTNVSDFTSKSPSFGSASGWALQDGERCPVDLHGATASGVLILEGL